MPIARTKINKMLKEPPDTLSKNMAELLADLSTLCREVGWHKSGVHLFVAAEELQNMIDRKEATQEMYSIPGRVK